MSYIVTLANPCEIRMGSPYNSADISITGGFSPTSEDLSAATFQDKYAISPKGDVCFVVEWVTTENRPAFRVWRIFDTEKDVKRSRIVEGCCEDISSLGDGNGVDISVWSQMTGIRNEIVRDFQN